MLRPLPQIAMRRRRLPVTLPKHAGSRDRHAELAGCANIRSRNGRTSMMGLQKADQKKHQIGCSGKCPYLWPAHHGHARADHTKDATDIKAHEPPSCGCSVVVLYNRFRPHSSLGYQNPADFAGTIAATTSGRLTTQRFRSLRMRKAVRSAKPIAGPISSRSWTTRIAGWLPRSRTTTSKRIRQSPVRSSPIGSSLLRHHPSSPVLAMRWLSSSTNAAASIPSILPSCCIATPTL